MDEETKTRGRSTLSTIVTVAICIWAICLAVDLMQEPFQVELKPEQSKDSPIQGNPFYWGKPPTLMTYAEYRTRSMKGDHQTVVEHSHRLMMFNHNTLWIGLQNFATLAGLSSFYMEQHLLNADLTLDEQFGTVLPENTNTTNNNKFMDENGHYDRMVRAPSGFLDAMHNQIATGMPNGIEVDLTFCLQEVRNQKMCGACYAFSTLAAMEWHYCRQSGNNTIDFSEQYMVDCGPASKLNGCDGGSLTNARRFIHFYGIKLEKDYPYKGKRSSFGKKFWESIPANCPDYVKEGALDVKIRDQDPHKEWYRIERSRENFEETLKEQPIVVEVNMPASANLFQRGIDDGKYCTGKLNHGMLLVGYGTENNTPYWLLRNSHGRGVNMNGYFRLKRDQRVMEKCLVSAFVTKPLFKDLGEEAHSKLYDSTFQYKPREAPTEVESGGVLGVRKKYTQR